MTRWPSFFFQAEDGIRDYDVTGVQTCALPISDLAGPYLAVCGVYAMVAIFVVFKGKFNKVNTDIP